MGEKWREIGAVGELVKEECHHVYAETGMDEDLVLVVYKDKFTAMSTWCSHMGGPLHGGKVMQYKSKNCLECPWHGYMFDIEDGVNPDMGLKQDVFQTKVEDGKVYINYPISRLSLQSFEDE